MNRASPKSPHSCGEDAAWIWPRLGSSPLAQPCPVQDTQQQRGLVPASSLLCVSAALQEKKAHACHSQLSEKMRERWQRHRRGWPSPRSWSMGWAGWDYTPETAPGLGSLAHAQHSPCSHQRLLHSREERDGFGMAEDVAGPQCLLKTEMWESRQHCVTASPSPLIPCPRRSEGFSHYPNLESPAQKQRKTRRWPLVIRCKWLVVTRLPHWPGQAKMHWFRLGTKSPHVDVALQVRRGIAQLAGESCTTAGGLAKI